MHLNSILWFYMLLCVLLLAKCSKNMKNYVCELKCDFDVVYLLIVVFGLDFGFYSECLYLVVVRVGFSMFRFYWTNRFRIGEVWFLLQCYTINSVLPRIELRSLVGRNKSWHFMSRQICLDGIFATKPIFELVGVASG